MKKYLGVKLIQAKPQDKNDMSFQEGYKVVYEDGYTSWSPKDVFEKAYREINNLTFGLAIEHLKKSLLNKDIPTTKVCRKGWGEGMWLSIVDPYNNKQFSLVEREIEGTFSPYIGIKTVDNCYVPWLASQPDMLAEDWMILE